MEVALVYSQLSKCNKLKVGAVIVKDGRPIVTGYNGMPCNSDDDNCEDEHGNTSNYVVHAEMNCICYAANAGISVKGAMIFITHAPCSLCSSVIIQSGIKRVVYLNDYKNNFGLINLKRHNIKTHKLTM